MAIKRWAPFSAFTSLEREMQEIVGRLTARPWLEGFTWKPATDVYREEGDLVIRAEVPGIDPTAGLDVEVEGNVLHIKGEKKEEREVSEDDRYVRECRYGSFRRDVMLPEGVNVDEIKASFDNGVLMVRIPVPHEAVEEAEAKRISVDVSRSEPEATTAATET